MDVKKQPHVVIVGTHTSAKSAPDYVEHIVYGEPEIFAVTVGSHFVALCRYDDAQDTQARATFDRMGSFPHGCSLTYESDVAWREFGLEVGRHAPKPSAKGQA